MQIRGRAWPEIEKIGRKREREREREIGKGREMPDDDRARVRFRDVYFCFDSR